MLALAFEFTLHYLLHEHLTTFEGCLLSDLLALVLNFQVFKPLNLHHGVETPLILQVLLLHDLIFLKLLVSDLQSLNKQNHPVHLLNVVLLLVDHRFGPRIDRVHVYHWLGQRLQRLPQPIKLLKFLFAFLGLLP